MGVGEPWQPLELFPSLELQLEKHHPGKGLSSKSHLCSVWQGLLSSGQRQ